MSPGARSQGKLRIDLGSIKIHPELNLTCNIYKFPSGIYSQHLYLQLSNIIGSTVTTGTPLTNTTTFSRPFQGLKKPLLPAGPLGKQVSHFARWAISCSSLLMILIFGQVSFKSHLPSKKISLCQTTTGCKENHFYSLPFGPAEARIY